MRSGPAAFAPDRGVDDIARTHTLQAAAFRVGVRLEELGIAADRLLNRIHDSSVTRCERCEALPDAMARSSGLS